MKDLINKALNELINDKKLNSNSLIKILTESVNKSIRANEADDSVYKQFKDGLVGINEHLKNKKIENMLSQFEKSEKTVDSELLKISKLANLNGLLEGIKSSNAYTNPIIKQATDLVVEQIKVTPEFLLYPAFIRDFTKFAHENSVKEAVDHVANILNEHASDLEVLYTIHTLTNMKSPIYESSIVELKEMLAKGKYTSDIINIKLGKTGLPVINNLVNSLKIVESRKSDSFTLGVGTPDTKVNNLIAPAIKSKDGSLMTYADGRFLRISESKKKIKPEVVVHIEEGKHRIATLDSEYVREKYPDFYNLSEAFARLGFNKSDLSEGIETSLIKNFKVGLFINESKDLDVYLNNTKIEDISKINLSEALVMEGANIRKKVEKIFENLNNIFNFEFIKNVSNHKTLSEATIFQLGDNYLLCEKLNDAERKWSKVNEYEMYEFFKEKFEYDISPIFKTKIDEISEAKKRLEERKKEINENINKLEGSIKKINETIESKSVKPDAVAKLEQVKESIESSIETLKEEFIKLDLGKKEINEGELPEGLKKYLEKKNAGKSKEEDKKDDKEEDKKDDKAEDKKKTKKIKKK